MRAEIPSVDPSRIQKNPYEHLTDPAERLEALRRDLVVFADLCGGAVDDTFYDTLNSLLDVRGSRSFVGLAFSLRNILGTAQEMEELKKCDSGHEMAYLEKLQIPPLIGLLELVEGPEHKSFQSWLRRAVRNGKISPPRESCARSFLEYLDQRDKEYTGIYGSAQRLRRSLTRGLNHGAQAQLLNSFAFSEPFRFGTELPDVRHLHCRQRMEKNLPVHVACYDFCDRATDSEAKEFLPVLATRLYEMRNQVVHAAAGVMFAVPWRKREPGVHYLGESLFDTYDVGGDRQIAYRVTMKVRQMNEMLRECAWNRIRSLAADNPNS